MGDAENVVFMPKKTALLRAPLSFGLSVAAAGATMPAATKTAVLADVAA